MSRWKKATVTLAAAACLMAALLPASSAADNLALALTPEKTVVETVSSADAPDETMIEQIRTTYAAAKKRARVKSFRGKCGKYVNQQLVILGINETYIGCNGNREYDTYYKLRSSTGGFKIHAYGAKKYTLQSALEAIAKENPHARNILVGFEKGTSTAGKKYGHALFIHGIENGLVYFSDSFAQTVDGVKYKEGEPIVCSVATFVKRYQKYRFDGVIWFE